MTRGDLWQPILRGLSFPEGPVVGGGITACVDVQDGAVWISEGREFQRWAVGGRPNGAALDDNGDLLIADAGRRAIVRLRPRARQPEVLCADDLLGPNDLIVEDGGLTFTDPGKSSALHPVGRVMELKAGRLRALRSGLAFPNGLLRLPGGRLLVAETRKTRVVAVGHGGVRLLAGGLHDQDGRGGPDGMCLLPDRRVAVAIFGAGEIVLLDTKTSDRVSLSAPGSRPTNLCQDGLHVYCTEVDTGALHRISLASLPARPLKDEGSA